MQEKVTTETLLAEVDFDQIKQAGKDPSVIVVLLNLNKLMKSS